MPEPRYSRRHRVPAIVTAVTMALWATLFAPGSPSRAADDKVLQRVKGQVSFQNPNAPQPSVIVGRQVIGDDAHAITAARSAATLTLPDSSIVALGENTNIQIGAFNNVTPAGGGQGATVTVTVGTLRFDVHRVNGALANYHFSTPTAQIAVRGTIGLLSLDANGATTVACVVCAADSVAVTVSATSQTFTLLSGQLLTISAAGAVVTAAITSAVLSSFSAAGVSTSAASGAAAATAGVAGAAGASSAAAVTTAAVAAGAVGAAAAISSASTSSNASPLPGIGNTQTQTPIPTPTGTGNGTINLTGFRPTPSPSPVARPTRAPQAPALGPPGRR